jgi:hypothetical protein
VEAQGFQVGDEIMEKIGILGRPAAQTRAARMQDHNGGKPVDCGKVTPGTRIGSRPAGMGNDDRARPPDCIVDADAVQDGVVFSWEKFVRCQRFNLRFNCNSVRRWLEIRHS